MKGQEEKNRSRYDDIISLPHYQSDKHPHMSVHDRAAQFSPFAALTGYEAAIKETGRLTQEEMELDEETRQLLSVRLQVLQKHLEEAPVVSITFFEPDEKKSGGSYQTREGRIQKIDPVRQILRMLDGTGISFRQIIKIEAELFDRYE